MHPVKQVKCVKCGTVVECNITSETIQCGCGVVKLRGGVIIEGRNGIDYVDVSQQMLCG